MMGRTAAVGSRVGGVTLVAVVVFALSAVACGPPAEECRGFAVNDTALTETPEGAVGLALYSNPGFFPSGAEPVLEERTDQLATYRLRNGGDTVGWITVGRAERGWGEPVSGTTCKARPVIPDESPPTSR